MHGMKTILSYIYRRKHINGSGRKPTDNTNKVRINQQQGKSAFSAYTQSPVPDLKQDLILP